MRVVVGLFNQPQFLSLVLVEPALDTVCFLQPLQTEDQEFCVVLVGERRKGDGRKPATLQPVHCRGINGHTLLSSDVWPILQVIVLTLLLCFQVETSQAAKILFADSLVHSCPTSDSLTIVVGSVGPPVCFRLDVTKDHVLNGNWKARHLHTCSR